MSPYLVVEIAWAVWLVSWLVAAWWSNPTVKRPSMDRQAGYRLLMMIGAMLLFGFPSRLAWVQVAVWQPGRDMAWALTAVSFCGLAITWWARATIGRFWSSDVARKADHEIVTAGPYRFVRHPIYSGIILALLAAAAMRGTIGACLGVTLMILSLVIKARMEERFLRGELGPERYDAYARRVPMLIPFDRMGRFHTFREGRPDA